jgi:hypothetical protein
MTDATTQDRLSTLAESLIRETTSTGFIREGVVMTIGPTPYRRLDCDGHALAYIRPRPRRQGVRVDVPGLWFLPKPCRLSITGAAGTATLLVQSEQDLTEAVGYLRETVERTRAAYARKR